MLSGLVIFLLTLGVLLAIPLTVQFELSWRKVLKGRITLLWLFGLVRIQFSPSSNKPPSSSGENWKKSFKQPKRTADHKMHLYAGIQQKAFRRRIIRYLQDCWHAIHKRDLTLHGRVGLGDPADTGQLWAVMGPIVAIMDNVQSASIHIEPEFIDTTLELDSNGDIRLIPLQLIYLTLGLFLSPSVWHGVKLMRGSV